MRGLEHVFVSQIPSFVMCTNVHFNPVSPHVFLAFVCCFLVVFFQVPYFDLVLVCRAKPGFPSHWGKVPNFLGSIPNFSGILPTARLPQTSKKTQPGNGFG